MDCFEYMKRNGNEFFDCSGDDCEQRRNHDISHHRIEQICDDMERQREPKE